MKKMTLAALVLCTGALNAQISYEGVGDFAKLADMTYDAGTPNRLYALTYGNHLMESVDNGATWSLKYTFPDSRGYLSDLKRQGSASLSFAVVGTRGPQDGIYTIDAATNAVQEHYQVPGTESGAAIISYDIQGGGQYVLVHTTFNDQELGLYTQVYYTTDGGQQWERVYYSPESDNVHVFTVAISPEDPSKLYIGRNLGTDGIDGGLLISGDAGEHWSEKLPGNTFKAIAFNPSDADDILLGTGFGMMPENLFRSLDGGDTWSALPIDWNNIGGNDIAKIEFHPTAPQNIVVLEENEILTSADNGLTWNKLVYPQDSIEYTYGLNASFAPADPAQIAISCNSYSRVTLNSAATLTPVRAPYYSADNVAFGKNGTEGQLYHGANAGRISKDLATGTSAVYDAMPLTNFMNVRNYVFAHPQLPGRMFSFESAGLLGGKLKVSSDYGATVQLLGIAMADDIQEIAYEAGNTATAYIAWRSGADGALQKINFADPDNIITEPIDTPVLGGDGEGKGVITGVALTPGAPNEIYIAKKSKFLKSSDAGLTWEEKINGLTQNGVTVILDMQRNPLNPDHFAMATNAGVLTSSDAGEHWVMTLPGQGYRSIKYSPTHNGVMAVSSYSAIGGISAAIAYTSDSGLSWNTISNAQLNYVGSYAMDYNFRGSEIDAYIATTDLGVLKYTITGIVLGMPEPVAGANPFIVYPNPAADMVSIGDADGTSAIAAVSVYTLNGQKVLEGHEPTIRLSGLTTGLYIVTVETIDGKRYSQKLVKL